MTDVVAETAERQWPPTPPAWIDDRATQRCTGRSCHVVFDGLVERRHHCRFCGNLFCHRCSARKAMMPPQWTIKEPQRCCDTCFSVLAPEQEGWIKGNANAERENFLEDDSTTKYFNSPMRFTLGGEIRKASYALQNLTDRDNVNYWGRDAEYATEMLEAVEGMLFMTVGKVAFIGGVRIGTGLVIAKLPDGTWSAPCAVGNFGVTFGACMGAEVTDMVTGIDRETMEKFANETVSNIMVGGEASVALGLLGRSATGEAYLAASGSDNSEAYMSYSHSRGGYAGVTVDAAYVTVRKDVRLSVLTHLRRRRCTSNAIASTWSSPVDSPSQVNEKFYGHKISARDILGGRVDRPRAAEPLYAALDRFYGLVFPQRGGNGGGNGGEFYGADGGAPPRTFAGGTGYVADGSAYGHRRASGAGDLQYDEYGRPVLQSAEPAAPRPAPVVRAQPGAPRVVSAVRAKPAGPVRAGRVVAARRSPSAGPVVAAVPPAQSSPAAPPAYSAPPTPPLTTPVVSAVRAGRVVAAAPPPLEDPTPPVAAEPPAPPAELATPEPKVDPLTGLPISLKKRVVAPKAGLFEDEEKEV